MWWTWLGRASTGRHRHATEERRERGPRIAMESMQGLLTTRLARQGTIRGIAQDVSEGRGLANHKPNRCGPCEDGPRRRL